MVLNADTNVRSTHHQHSPVQDNVKSSLRAAYIGDILILLGAAGCATLNYNNNNNVLLEAWT